MNTKILQLGFTLVTMVICGSAAAQDPPEPTAPPDPLTAGEHEATRINAGLVESWTGEDATASELKSALNCIDALPAEAEDKPDPNDANEKIQEIITSLNLALPKLDQPVTSVKIENLRQKIAAAASTVGADKFQDLNNALHVLEAKVLHQEMRGKQSKIAERYEKQLQAFHGKVQTANACERADVLCLDENGEFLGGPLPHSLRAGSKVTVVIIVPVENTADYSVSLSENQRIDVLVEDATTGETGTESDSRSEICKLLTDAEVGYKAAVNQVFTIPKSIGISDVSIDFAGNGKSKSYRAFINHGYYYVDVGLFIPFALNGKQRILSRQLGEERYVALDKDLHVTAGIAMNVFPGGRRRGELTPWSNLPKCSDDQKNGDKRGCRRWQRSWAELMGFQIGADLDVRDPIDQFYFGVVFEPVTGVTLSAGSAIMKIDHFKPGVFEGQLVATDADLEPRSLYRARFFASFGLSLDLVQAIRAVRDRLEEQKL